MRTRRSPRNQEILWRRLGQIATPFDRRPCCVKCGARYYLSIVHKCRPSDLGRHWEMLKKFRSQDD